MADTRPDPAFPDISGDEPIAGMTLRDFFAGRALSAMIPLHRGTKGANQTNEQFADSLARYSYIYADAMLKARQS